LLFFSLQLELGTLPNRRWRTLRGNFVRGIKPRSMAIHRLLQQRVFEPELIALMTDAYERVLGTLGLTERSDLVTQLVAEKIIAAVESGVRDGEEIHAQIIAAFQTQQPSRNRT
jgi:hypothetical protein